MKFYLIDDDQNILNILKLVIKNRNLGEICGTSLNPSDALEAVSYTHLISSSLSFTPPITGIRM